MSAWPALILRFPSGTSAATRDRLVALLADHALVAIHEDDPFSPRSWTIHFADVASRDAAQAELAKHPDAAGIGLEPVLVPDDDWARRTQADLRAITIGRITVAPPWDLPVDKADDPLVIVIEPSRGFGTGHHQSTRLCLILLQQIDVSGKIVVDVGTGSGVLAIAASRLGASRVTALDEDPDAIANAIENIERNAVANVVAAEVCDALSGSPTTFGEVVLANLTGSLLARHAEAVNRFVVPGGLLIVAGLTIDERARVIEAFAPAFEVVESADEDDWCALVLRKP